MTEGGCDRLEQRVLVLAPTSKDATLTSSVLARARVACVCCLDLAHVCHELEAGAAVVILPEEAIAVDHGGRLSQWLATQPPWSDVPLLVLARPGADSAAVAQAMDLLGNVTVLERPMRVASLVSAVRTAMRARQRQYQIREHLTQHERAEQALRDADRRKDEFLAILAHELRNPLAPIRNSVNILRLSSHDSAAERVAEMMDRQVNHMVRLVDDLLEVARISRGKLALRKATIDAAAVVRSAVEASRPLMDAGSHQLALSIPTEPLTLEGDFVRLTQVVANLLNNAAKYSDPSGRIWLAVQREGSEVVISVRDTGIGIPPDVLPRVFELFMQGDHRASRDQGGLGIGLTLVKSLVEMHDGRVEVHSEGAGRGSEFVIRLPLGGARAGAGIAEKAASPSKVLASRRVLVVDDNCDAAESLAALIELLGADVHVEHSGARALEAFAAYKPAVAILDIGMPGMDGYEVARRIRQQPEAQDVTLVALTGWGQEEDRLRAQLAGFDYHLIKPLDIAALQSVLVATQARPVGTGTRP